MSKNLVRSSEVLDLEDPSLPVKVKMRFHSNETTTQLEVEGDWLPDDQVWTNATLYELNEHGEPVREVRDPRLWDAATLEMIKQTNNPAKDPT